MSNQNRRLIKERLWKKQGGKCVSCGVQCILDMAEGLCPSNQFTLDHIVPLGMGGDNSQSNLQGMCFECNQKKGNGTWKKARRRHYGIAFGRWMIGISRI